MQKKQVKDHTQTENKDLEEKFLRFYNKEVNIRVRLSNISHKKKSQS